MAFTPKKAYIVSQTHWDREWYLTYHNFRVNMCRIIRQILDVLESRSKFKHFLLDGQSVILEDHVEIYPEDEKRIRKLAKKGAVSLGPWYMLPDEFLISAESHARNLFYGNKVSMRFGGWNRAGYMPDSFGHTAQMPQILNLGGIDSFVFTRGSGEEIEDTGFEFNWKAPDGSSVLTVNQCGGYCSAGALGYEELWHAHTRREVKPKLAVEKIKNLFEKMGERSNGDIVLINNGCDHLPPQQEFTKILNGLKKAFPETEFIHTSLEEYISAIKDAGFVKNEFQGEMIFGYLHPIISGVWSTRMYLKQMNDNCQNLVSNNWEPISAYTHFMHGQEYPSGLLEYSWKLLLKNHPHDSICGCSIDEVHQEMIPRFEGVSQTAERSMINQMENLAPTFARKSTGDRDTVLCVMNPLPVERKEIIERLVVLQPFGIEPEDLHLVDPNGKEVPFKILDKWYVRRFWEVDYRTFLMGDEQLEKFSEIMELEGPRIIKTGADKKTADCFFLIQFEANLPSLTHMNYRLVEKKDSERLSVPDDGVKVTENSLENQFCKVEIYPNGSFDLLDKLSNKTYTGLNVFEDTEDIGDEYDYSPCENTKTVTTEKIDNGFIEVLRDGGLKGTLEVNFSFAIPESISEDRKSRSGDLVGCRYLWLLLLRRIARLLISRLIS